MSRVKNEVKLVLALTLDDRDGSMLLLANKLREKYVCQGFKVFFTEASTELALAFSESKLISSIRKHDISELVVVGHSEYFTNRTNFRGKLYDIIPIADRTLGGISLRSVSELIATLIHSKRIPQVTLLCCESATTTRLYESDIAPCTWELDEIFDSTMESTVSKRCDDDISSLQYICSMIYSRTARCPRVSGLNGFGFIDPTSDEPINTFPSELYHKIPDVNTTARAVLGGKAAKHDRAFAKVLASCEAKTSPHVVSYCIQRF